MKSIKDMMLLYAVTDRAWTGEKTLFEQAEAALKGGITCLQLREKELDEEEFLREAIENIFCEIFGTEDALVRNQFISGTQTISTTLFGILRPGDIVLSINGKPYDTLDEVIGLRDNPSSLMSYGIKYDQG